METYNCCQSCSMPLDDLELLGTEKGGLKSHKYCKYCYQDGEFTNPGMSLDEMIGNVSKRMKDMNLPENIIQRAVDQLPFLSRWAGKLPLAKTKKMSM